MHRHYHLRLERHGEKTFVPNAGGPSGPKVPSALAVPLTMRPKNMLDAARIGRQTANSPEAQRKRAETQRKNALAQHAWKPSGEPAWLTERFYSEKVQPLLASISASAIARQISVSRWYAGRIRGTGRRWRGWREFAPKRKFVNGSGKDMT